MLPSSSQSTPNQAPFVAFAMRLSYEYELETLVVVVAGGKQAFNGFKAMGSAMVSAAKFISGVDANTWGVLVVVAGILFLVHIIIVPVLFEILLVGT